MAIEKCITSIGGQTKYLKLCCYFVVMVQSNQIDLCWKRYQLILIGILSSVWLRLQLIPTIQRSLTALDMYEDPVHLPLACKMHIVSEMDLRKQLCTVIEYCLDTLLGRAVSSRG
jgi:hypothetical protein